LHNVVLRAAVSRGFVSRTIVMSVVMRRS
jgi:hypothetical protein